LAGAPHGVDGEATRLRVLVPPSLQQDALAPAKSTDVRLQRLIGQAGDERECLLDGRQAPISIDPGERAAELEPRPGLLVGTAMFLRIAGQRLEALDGGLHVAHGPADLSQLLEEG